MFVLSPSPITAMGCKRIGKSWDEEKATNRDASATAKEPLEPEGHQFLTQTHHGKRQGLRAVVSEAPRLNSPHGL